MPFIWLLNRNSKHTTYAGAWTLVNAHELAIISGKAAAYKLGAAYPKELYENDFAKLCCLTRARARTEIAPRAGPAGGWLRETPKRDRSTLCAAVRFSVHPPWQARR